MDPFPNDFSDSVVLSHLLSPGSFCSFSLFLLSRIHSITQSLHLSAGSWALVVHTHSHVMSYASTLNPYRLIARLLFSAVLLSFANNPFIPFAFCSAHPCPISRLCLFLKKITFSFLIPFLCLFSLLSPASFRFSVTHRDPPPHPPLASL